MVILESYITSERNNHEALGYLLNYLPLSEIFNSFNIYKIESFCIYSEVCMLL